MRRLNIPAEILFRTCSKAGGLVIKHYHEKKAAETEIFGASVTFATSVDSVWLIQSRSFVLAVVDTIFKVLERKKSQRKKSLPKVGILQETLLWNKNWVRPGLELSSVVIFWCQQTVTQVTVKFVNFTPTGNDAIQSPEWNLPVASFPRYSKNFSQRWSFNSENVKCSWNQWKTFFIKM